MENECEYVSSHGLLKSSNFYRLNSYTNQNNNDEHILNNIENYDTLYIPASNLNFFANIYLNKLNVKIILITGDDDDIIPYKFPEETKAILESPNIIHWFAQNCLINHNKITHLPIGLDYHTIYNKNTFWGPSKTPIEQEEEIKNIILNSKPFYERNVRIYSTFHFELNRGDRMEAYDNIPKDLIDYEPEKITRLESHKKQISYTFVASPFGNGPDCHRTWEALVLGCIPIIKSSGMDALFEDLPVLLVKEWKDVSKELLENTIEKFKHMTFNYEKLKLSYWINKINSYKKYNLIVAGLCKNIEQYLNNSINNILKVAKRFDSYKIILVENDSSDNTRNIIKNFMEIDSNIKGVFIDNLASKINAKYRTENIAYCRNLCQDIISLYKKDYPYTLMVDMDDCLQSEKFTYEGVMSSINYLEKDRTLAFVGAVIDGPYYDIYALRHELCNYNCWKMFFTNLDKMTPYESLYKFVKSHQIDYSKSHLPILVNSAFGGAGVFRNKYWILSRYCGIEPDRTESCEHVPMCLKLGELGYKLILNPKFILY